MIKLKSKAISEKLRKLRGEKSRKEVAKLLGISVSAIAMYETGERIPNDNIKIKYAQIFNSSVEDIFFK